MTETTTLAGPATPPAKLGPRLAARVDGGNIVLRRWAGCWLDFIVLALLAALFLFSGAGRPWAGAGLLVGFLAVLAYFPITEGLWGRSAGKWLTGTIVIDENGDPPGIPRVLVRTALRLVEVNPFLVGGVPAGLFALFTKHHQRLGDILANTYVVPVKALVAARSADPAFDAFD